jgi:hypothetical protein
MGLELEKGCVESYIFKKQLSKLSFTLFLCFLHCSFTSDAQRKFVGLQFAHPMT